MRGLKCLVLFLWLLFFGTSKQHSDRENFEIWRPSHSLQNRGKLERDHRRGRKQESEMDEVIRRLRKGLQKSVFL